MAYLPLLPVSHISPLVSLGPPYSYTYHACSSPDSPPVGRPRQVIPPRLFTITPLPLDSTAQGRSAPVHVIAAIVRGGRLLFSEYTPRYSCVLGQRLGERAESEGTIDGGPAIQDQVP